MDFDRMLRYCEALERNNDRTWFHERENHALYVAAKEDFTELLLDLKFRLSEVVDGELSERLLFADPKAMQYRIPRDMRIHKNAPPYQPSFRAYISRDRKSWQPIGYFLRLAPGISCYGTGLWCESTAATNRAREYFRDNWMELKELLEDGGLTLSGSSLKTMPRGFSADHPAASWLKLREWMVLFDLEDRELESFDDVADQIKEMTSRLHPLRLFLMEAAKYAAAGEKMESEWE